MTLRMRRHRERLGLTQAELAALTGLSRQAIGAAESGRHAPGVDAALALANALGTTVEELFGAPVDLEPAVEAGAPPNGTLVVAVRVGDSMRYAAAPDAGAAWPAADGVVRRDRVALFPDSDPLGAAIAGCDPALGLAAAMLPRRGPRRLVPVPTTSTGAIDAVVNRRVHAALVHGPAEALPPAPRGQIVRLVARWEVGLAYIGAPVDRERVALSKVAQRSPGAAAQQAFMRWVGDRRVAGPTAAGHIDAARYVATGSTQLAVTMRPACGLLGLGFQPLEEHVVELRVPSEFEDHPGVKAFVELVESRAWRRRVEALDGYWPVS
jgi:DNA-binding XRE family transcriptional regulator